MLHISSTATQRSVSDSATHQSGTSQLTHRKNVYNKVEITISTTVHQADSVSVKDIQLARYLERVGSIDLNVTSLLDYYNHRNVALDVKKLYNDQEVPTKGKSGLLQLGLKHEGLIYGGQLRLEGKKEAESILPQYEEDDSVEGIVKSLHNVAYDRYNSKGKERIAELMKRDFQKERDYESEEYLSDDVDAPKMREGEDLRLEYKE